MTEITAPEKLDALAKLARKATPGPWQWDTYAAPNGGLQYCLVGRPQPGSSVRRPVRLDEDGTPDRALVEAANPDLLIALIAEVKTLRRQLARRTRATVQ